MAYFRDFFRFVWSYEQGYSLLFSENGCFCYLDKTAVQKFLARQAGYLFGFKKEMCLMSLKCFVIIASFWSVGYKAGHSVS